MHLPSIPLRRRVPLQQYLRALGELFLSRDFAPLIGDYMRQQEPARQDLRSWMRWQPGAYTRNLIHREYRFEVLLLCWEFGAASPVHDHGGQRCWAQVVSGSLCVEAFELANPQRARQTGAGIWIVAQPGKQVMQPGDIDFRGLAAPAHRVSNADSAQERAVSLHVYARPLRDYVIYNPVSGHAVRHSVTV